MSKAQLSVSVLELGALAEALREALAAELLAPESRAPARELLERVDEKLPSAATRPLAGGLVGRLIAEDELVRELAAREDRYGQAAMTREELAFELDAKPAGTSVRELLDGLLARARSTRVGKDPCGDTS